MTVNFTRFLVVTFFITKSKIILSQTKESKTKTLASGKNDLALIMERLHQTEIITKDK